MNPKMAETVVKKLSEAFELVSKAIELHPRFGEAFYCRAKYRCVGEKIMGDIAIAFDAFDNPNHYKECKEDYQALKALIYYKSGNEGGIWSWDSEELMFQDTMSLMRNSNQVMPETSGRL